VDGCIYNVRGEYSRDGGFAWVLFDLMEDAFGVIRVRLNPPVTYQDGPGTPRRINSHAACQAIRQRRN
jgi:hypothetical protein